jgi:hypothetical protein
MKPKLPFRFIWATLLIALVWFIIMFMYIDDLMKDENKEPGVHGKSKVRMKVDKWVVAKTVFRDHLRKKQPHRKPVKFIEKNPQQFSYNDDEEEEDEVEPGNYSKGVNLEYIDDEDVAKYVLTQRTGIRIHRKQAKKSAKRIVTRPLKKSRIVYVSDSLSSESRKYNEKNQLVWQGSSKIISARNTHKMDMGKSSLKARVPNEGIILDRSNIMAQVNNQIREMEAKEKMSHNYSTNDNDNSVSQFQNDNIYSAKVDANNADRHINTPMENNPCWKRRYSPRPVLEYR